MSIEIIPLTKLRPSNGNPRQNFKMDGLLQNFVAIRPEGRGAFSGLSVAKSGYGPCSNWWNRETCQKTCLFLSRCVKV